MDQSRVQCPVCTLYLHSGMSLESHLDTHPKDQVIKALCSLSVKSPGYGSRTPTPMHSERSYRSRSRTPVADDGMRWMGSHRSSDNERYWRRTPSRNKSTPSSNMSRNDTPEIRVGDMNFENNSAPSSEYMETSYPLKSDKMQQTYIPTPTGSDTDQQSPCFTDSQEDKEVKYSRSSEYSSIDNSTNTFTCNMPPMSAGTRIQMHAVPPISRRANSIGNNIVKIVPKPNLLVKTNMTGVQYIAQGSVKPMRVMMPTAPTFVQKNLQSNMIVTGSLPCAPMLDTKTVGQQLGTSHFNQLSSNNFTPGTTVVTQNSQIIYREMVHTLDGKPFISNMPAVLGGHNAVTNVAQTSSLYQNVMVVDQFGNTSCMYPPPHQFISKPCNATIYTDPSTQSYPKAGDSKPSTNKADGNKTLIIEVSPIVSKRHRIPIPISSLQPESKSLSQKSDNEKIELKYDAPGSSKGLKILSNIKVEVPVQHNKNMLNTVMDLTGSLDNDYTDRSDTPEKILPDLEDNRSNDSTQRTIGQGKDLPTHAFSVIQNVGNTESPKSEVCDNKMDIEFSDSCPVPDLICNEKPSISPCSELSEQGDSNSTDQPPMSPKPKILPSFQKKIDNKLIPLTKVEIRIEKKLENKPDNTIENDKKPPARVHRHNNIRLNNLYVKKHKKVLQIKNAKSFPVASSSSTNVLEPKPSSSTCRSPENYSIKKKSQSEKKEIRSNMLQILSISKIKDNDNDDPPEFDANIEEQSMDIEPVAPSCIGHSREYNSLSVEVEVKEENNSSNEGAFGGESDRSIRDMTPIEGLRPINVITYGNMVSGEFDEDSNHKELLDLEAASKSKPFVSIINDNYFADYFNSERGEAFQAEKQADFEKETSKDGIYPWGESSQKGEGEFVLPNFIHESYKIAESSGAYSEVGGEERQVDGDGEKCEQDSKADVLSESRSEGETPLNICADERMPPRGELSGQESNGDMESPWMYTEVTPSEPYDLIARESWVSDGSEVDASEKRENLEEDLSYPKRQYTCSQCCARCGSARELRAHRALAHAHAHAHTHTPHAHAPPACSANKTSYSRMLTARAIKKEEKPDASVLDVAGNLLALADTKDSIATTMLQVYDAMAEAKPQLMGIIKQETKRKRRDFLCPTCKVDQHTDMAFHAHLKIHPLECLTCGKCFFKRANLALHMKTHLGIKNYKCDVCEKRFVTRQKLSEHYNIHTGRAPFKCTHCEDTFRRYSNMVQHRDRHHFQKKAKVRDFVCQCGAVFHSRAKLLWHKETHEERPKACLYCSDKFVHAASLTRHVRRTHNEYYLSERLRGKVDNVPCPVCKQVYLRTNLRAHLQTHSGKRPYLCIICNKSFTTKWNLKLHRWTHASRSAKPYKCSLCKGAFIRHTEYISHMNAHKSVRPYTCNYCGCQFIRKYNCQRHVREHEMAKKYVCKVPECGKSFHRSYYLSEHMKVHSGARPFSCNICGKTSSNKSNHNKHVKIHHAREPVATEA